MMDGVGKGYRKNYWETKTEELYQTKYFLHAKEEWDKIKSQISGENIYTQQLDKMLSRRWKVLISIKIYIETGPEWWHKQ